MNGCATLTGLAGRPTGWLSHERHRSLGIGLIGFRSCLCVCFSVAKAVVCDMFGLNNCVLAID